MYMAIAGMCYSMSKDDPQVVVSERFDGPGRRVMLGNEAVTEKILPYLEPRPITMGLPMPYCDEYVKNLAEDLAKVGEI